MLAVLRPIWNATPETASRLRARIETVIDAARAAGHISQDKPNPARWKGHLSFMLGNPRKVGPARHHHAAMDYDQLPAFMAELAAIDSDPSKALQITILTCARPGETLGMTWDEIDFERAVWSIEAGRMKMNKPHQVPLSDEALAILRGLHERRGDNPHVFAGRPMRPLSAMSMSMLLRRMKIDATTHGMRASFRMWAADQGIAFEVAEAALAHATGSAVVQAYQRPRPTRPTCGMPSEWGRPSR